MKKHLLPSSSLVLAIIGLTCAMAPLAFGQIGLCPVTTQVPTGNPVATLPYDASVNECYANPYDDPTHPCCPAAASIDLPAGQYIVTLNGDVWSTEGYGGPAALSIAWGSGSCPSHSSANSCILIDPRDPRGGPLLINHPGGPVYVWRNDNYFGDNYGLSTIKFYSVGNQPPVAADQSVTTDADSPIDITLIGTDPESDPLTFAIVSNPSHGTLTGTPPNVTYTPAHGFSGKDGFTFKANDGQNDSNVGKVSVTVLCPPGSPAIAILPIAADIYMTEDTFRTAIIPLQVRICGNLSSSKITWTMTLTYQSPVSGRSGQLFKETFQNTPAIAGLDSSECVDTPYPFPITAMGGTLVINASASVDNVQQTSSDITVNVLGYQFVPEAEIISTLTGLYGSVAVGLADLESKFYSESKGQFDTDRTPYITDNIGVGLMQLNLRSQDILDPSWNDWASYWDWLVNAQRGIESLQKKLIDVDNHIRQKPLTRPLLSQLPPLWRENWALIYYGGIPGPDPYIPAPNPHPIGWVQNPNISSKAKQYVNVVRQRAFDITQDASVLNGKIP